MNPIHRSCLPPFGGNVECEGAIPILQRELSIAQGLPVDRSPAVYLGTQNDKFVLARAAHRERGGPRRIALAIGGHRHSAQRLPPAEFRAAADNHDGVPPVCLYFRPEDNTDRLLVTRSRGCDVSSGVFTPSASSTADGGVLPVLWVGAEDAVSSFPSPSLAKRSPVVKSSPDGKGRGAVCDGWSGEACSARWHLPSHQD
eukprot:CAMPEP_0195604480 /NCGR_PEP_ID=MMETSP0815-20121206/6664_1 /TAXON_ID=97485 /ORGANISM="Prymnesium parvum, Strain Texoma1" /LENGTH=199 /DNA_ID=CAMNT_0040744137 /DNA_START=839 /DNA_END=1434 /DNA_ORIENTATION=+